MRNLPITIDHEPKTEKRYVNTMNDSERVAYYADTAKLYAGQIRELYHYLLDAPLRRADVATAARMSTLITELNIMTGLVTDGLERTLEIAE